MIESIILQSFRLCIPIAIAAIGASICERSGIINIGMEGMMSFGAIMAVAGAYLFESAWIGLLFGMVAGAILGFVHAVFTIRFGANQMVTGIGINLAIDGLAPVIIKAMWNRDGISESIMPMRTVTLPGISTVPALGRLFTDVSPYFFLLLVLIPVSWYTMYRTRWGLRLRALGDNPKATASVGIKNRSYRYICVIFSGILCGIAGAYLSTAQTNLYVTNMISGRGYMALAANIFGGWNPLGAFGASYLFAIAQAVRLSLTEVTIPSQVVQMLPYMTTLAVLFIVRGKAKAPEHLGIPDD